MPFARVQCGDLEAGPILSTSLEQALLGLPAGAPYSMKLDLLGPPPDFYQYWVPP